MSKITIHFVMVVSSVTWEMIIINWSKIQGKSESCLPQELSLPSTLTATVADSTHTLHS